MVEGRGRNPWAARNLARNPRFDQSGETQLYGSNSLNRQDCFSQTLLLPGCSSTSASPRLVLRAFKPQLSLTESFSCSLKMSDRKAVIKNADMSEEMQQVMSIESKRGSFFSDTFQPRTLSTAPPRPWRSTTLRRTLQLTSRRSLTKSKTDYIEFVCPDGDDLCQVQPHMALHCWQELWFLCHS